MPPFIVQPFSFFKTGVAPIPPPPPLETGFVMNNGGNPTLLVRINTSGTVISLTGAPSAFGQRFNAGARAGDTALYYAGQYTSGAAGLPNTLRRVYSNTALAGADTFIGTGRSGFGGAGNIGGNAMFWGGTSSSQLNTCTRATDQGALVGSETNIGSARASPAGSEAGGNGLFYSGTNDNKNATTNVTRVNSSGALVGSETSVGNGCWEGAGSGASVGGNAMFYSGFEGNLAGSITCTRINSSGALVGTTTGDITRSSLAGGSTSGLGIFCGGTQNSNRVTRINSSGTFTGVFNTISGYAGQNHAGVGF